MGHFRYRKLEHLLELKTNFITYLIQLANAHMECYNSRELELEAMQDDSSE